MRKIINIIELLSISILLYRLVESSIGYVNIIRFAEIGYFNSFRIYIEFLLIALFLYRGITIIWNFLHKRSYNKKNFIINIVFVTILLIIVSPFLLVWNKLYYASHYNIRYLILYFAMLLPLLFWIIELFIYKLKNKKIIYLAIIILILVPLYSFVSIIKTQIDEINYNMKRKNTKLFRNKGNYNYDSYLNKNQNRLLLLYFTGYSCLNCRIIEAELIRNEKIINKITDEYIIVSLYVDDRNELDEDNWIILDNNIDTLKSIGSINQYIQKEKFKSEVQPFFVILNKKGDYLKSMMYSSDIEKFELFLDK